MNKVQQKEALRLLEHAMNSLTDEAAAMDEQEIAEQPIVLGHLRLSDSIREFLRGIHETF